LLLLLFSVSKVSSSASNAEDIAGTGPNEEAMVGLPEHYTDAAK